MSVCFLNFSNKKTCEVSTMHLSIFQRTRIIDLYLYYKDGSNVCDIIKTVAKERFNIEISRGGELETL